MKKRQNESIKLAALGGVGELGKNMYLAEVDEDIYVIDAGLMFPENEMLGIDIVIPDVTYLVQNKERVKGIFLTHGHEDHIGGLSYVLAKVNVPVYGTKLTLALAKAKMKEQEYKGKAQFIEINSDTRVEFDSANVTFLERAIAYRIVSELPYIHQRVQLCIPATLNSIRQRLTYTNLKSAKWRA